MTPRELREAADAYARIIAAWRAQREALVAEADSYATDTAQLAAYQKQLEDRALGEEMRQRYKRRKRK